MKNVRRICGKALLLSLCMVLLLLAGCTSREEPEENPLYSIEMTDENSMEITLVNASGCPVQEVTTWWDGESDGFDLLHDLDRDLAPDESISVRLPRCEYGVYSYLAKGVEGNGLSYLYGHSFIEIPEGGIIVLLPTERYADEIQTVFEAGADVEALKETTLAQYQAACEAELEAERAAEEAGRAAEEAAEEEQRQEAEKWKRLANLSQEEIDEAVELLGYKSLADMRTKRNPYIAASEDEQERQEAFYELYGYWYPNGDRNSLTYIAITNEELMWYQFDPEQGDVQLGKLRLAVSSGGTYRCTFALTDGNKFTVERTSLLHALSKGTLTFEDSTKQYSDDVEYYFSRY